MLPIAIVVTIFEIEIDGKTIRWNISEMQKAADEGMFGPPVRIPMAGIGETNWSTGGVSRYKVDAIKKNQKALKSPVIAVEAPPPDQKTLLCFCDGQHRVTARKELLFPYVSTYIVPWSMERGFRI